MPHLISGPAGWAKAGSRPAGSQQPPGAPPRFSPMLIIRARRRRWPSRSIFFRVKATAGTVGVVTGAMGQHPALAPLLPNSSPGAFRVPPLLGGDRASNPPPALWGVGPKYGPVHRLSTEVVKTGRAGDGFCR